MSLLTGLQVYYKLENTSDATGGGLTLTNNGSVTFGPGKVGNCATFVSASSQYLSRVDSAAFQRGTGDFSVCCWSKFTTNASGICIVQYGNTSSGAPGYGIVQSGTKPGIEVSDGSNSASKDSIVTCNDGVWHFIVATFKRSGNASIFVDDGVADAASMVAVSGSVNNSNGFAIGGRFDGAHLFDGSVDEVGIWDRVLTPSEKTALWNNGNGTTYPFGSSVAQRRTLSALGTRSGERQCY